MSSSERRCSRGEKAGLVASERVVAWLQELFLCMNGFKMICSGYPSREPIHCSGIVPPAMQPISQMPQSLKRVLALEALGMLQSYQTQTGWSGLQMDELAGKQRQQRGEAAALAGCGRVVGVAQAGRSDAAQQDRWLAEQSLLACRTEFVHAATRHCYFQRAEMQLLLRQLRFCAAELAGRAGCHFSSLFCPPVPPPNSLIHTYMRAPACTDAQAP